MAKGKDNLNKSEQDEMKALQDERKATEGHMSDSHRIRLSELINKEKGEGEQVGAKETTASSAAAAAEDKEDKEESTSSQRFSSGTIGNKNR